jgi:hypothetical protein
MPKDNPSAHKGLMDDTNLCPQAYSQPPKSSSPVLTCLLVICVLHSLVLMLKRADALDERYWGRMRLICCRALQGVMTDRILDLKRKWYRGRDREPNFILGDGTAYLANCG